MASLHLFLYFIMLSCNICTAFVKSSVTQLEEVVEEFLPDLKEHSRQPGVAIFEQYDNTHIHTFYNGRKIFNTLTEDGHFPNITLQFKAFGQRFLVDLHLTRDLFSSSYTRNLHHESGIEVQKLLHAREHCYYQGSIQHFPNSHAALSSCEGFRGYISDGQETYHIHHLTGNVHRVFRNKDRKKVSLHCGTEFHDTFQPPKYIFKQHSRRKRSIESPYDSNQNTRYVELYLVSDYRTFDRHGKNSSVVFKRTQDIANIVNSLYRQLNMYVVLVGVEVWGTGDKIIISSSADATMENFLRYRKERINPYHPNDNAQLITGIYFDHGVVGKAIKGPICTHQFSGGVNMDYDGLVTLVATTVAHEMGHNFGMEHDNDTKCSCPEEKCIMADTSGQISPHHWSSCSQNALHEAFELGMDYCLRNTPKQIFDGPICGNGFKEKGEECDCGLPKDCSNRCCNATTCQLHSQAQCATGRCCDLTTCKPKASSSLCREPVGECDLPEFCDGTNEFCPPDVFIENGQSCSEGQSYCYKGKCNTHNAQCQLLWGSTGRVSDPICFQQLNVRGDHDGNCGYNWTNEQYHTCDRENVLCGLLHCVHLNEKLMFWRDNLALDMRANFLTRGNTQYVCRSAMLDVGLDMPDPGLVPDGAKCEERKICINQACVPLMKLNIPKCPYCHDNGVCNSEGHCHCNVGYAPPLCDQPGYGGSIDSGPASNEYTKRSLLIGLLVLFLVILPMLALAFLAYINRRRLASWWKLGPRIKFGVLKKQHQPQQAPQPRLSATFSEKRWSSAPPKPSPVLEISGPVNVPLNQESQAQPPLPVKFEPPAHPATRPMNFTTEFKEPGARIKKQVSGPVPQSSSFSKSNRDRKSFLDSSKSSQPAMFKDSDNTSTNDKPAIKEAPRHLHLININQKPKVENAVVEKDDKRAEKEAKVEIKPLPNLSNSPTRTGRKVIHSNSLREPIAKDKHQSIGSGEKVLKRESLRGSEISCPVLVSTTNRDSQVFADFEFDESGIVGRPTSTSQKGPGMSITADSARDGSRSAVRRTQSDRPLSPKRRGIVVEVDDSKVGPGQTKPFKPRPLPPEPVLETEPLYINEDFSDLSDLKVHISNAFDNIDLNFPPSESDTNQPDTQSILTRPNTKPKQNTSADISGKLFSSKSGPDAAVKGSTGFAPNALNRSSFSSIPNKEKAVDGAKGGGSGSSNQDKNSTSNVSRNVGGKSSDSNQRTTLGLSSKGPQAGAANKGPKVITSNKRPMASASSKEPPSSAASAPNTGPTPKPLSKGPIPNASSKAGPTTALNKPLLSGSLSISSVPTRDSASADVPSKGHLSLGLSASDPGKGVKPNISTRGPLASSWNKGTSAAGSDLSKEIADGTTTASTKGAEVGNNGHLQRTPSDKSSRPAVAPKPQPNKSVRSYNF